MNPKSINDLDPKLKETYERVMGTSFSPRSAPPQRPLQTTVVQQTETISPQPLTPAQTIPQQPVASGPEMVASPQGPKMGDPFTEVEAPPATILIKATKTQKKLPLMPIFVFVGGVIFFIVYALVWAKVFGLF